MISETSLPRVTAELLDAEEHSSRGIECPACHTEQTSLTHTAVDAGAHWQCVRCGQHWDAARLAAVTAYVTWTIGHDRAGEARQAAAPDTQATSCIDKTP